MNWNNIDLTDGYERSQQLIDGLSFDTLLLEIACNLPEINESSVSAQFEIDLQSRIDEARDVFKYNLNNIVLQAKKRT